jgi:hypothetical protein
VSNYVKSTNFSAKDTLPLNDPAKIVKGTELDIEFNNIATAVNSKANSVNSALSGVPTAPTAAINTDTTQIANTAFVVAEVADYAPAKDGTGATGTWAVDITGSAATATNATNAVNLTGTATSNIQTSALGSGVANNTTFLRGDRTFQPIPVSATTANVLAATAGASFGAVGTYAFLSRIGATSLTFIQGSNYAGSDLAPAGLMRNGTGNAGTDQLNDMAGTRDGTGIGGTWKCMGRNGNTSTRDLQMTLFLRIS